MYKSTARREREPCQRVSFRCPACSAQKRRAANQGAHQYQHAMASLNGRALYPSNVVVSATWLPLLEEIVRSRISRSRSRARSRISHREILAAPDAANAAKPLEPGLDFGAIRKGRDQEPSCHCLRWRRSREDWPTMCVCESMPGNGSGDLWVNTDTKKKTAPRKAEEGKQWEAAKGQWSTGRPGGADPSPAGAPSAGPALPVQRPQSMVESPGPAAIQPPPPPSKWTGKWSRW